MMYEVLISYPKENYVQAHVVCKGLEDEGISCWIAPRDIQFGENWAGAIIKGIELVQTVLVVTSTHTFQSSYVIREVERASSKNRLIIPLFIEEVDPIGPLSLYFGNIQCCFAYSGTIEENLPKLIEQLKITIRNRSKSLDESDLKIETSKTISVENLIALGRSICWDIREKLSLNVQPEDMLTIEERKHGQQVKPIDIECIKVARRRVGEWEKRLKCNIQISGEDIKQNLFPGNDRARIICWLDSLDGTQHWLRSRDLYCTAVSFFLRGEEINSPYQLLVSLIQKPDGTIFIAREDHIATYIDGQTSPIRISKTAKSMGEAHVCTSCRRPEQYKVLIPALKKGSPFAGLYSFGGNAILVELTLGLYDAVFQADATIVNDNQELWDWIPGAHIAFRSGCSVLDLNSNIVDLTTEASAIINGKRNNFPYVVSLNIELGREIVTWLSS